MKINFKPIRYTLTAAAAMSLFSACEPEIERDLSDYEQVHGEADFSTYVALGNSLTAGVMDNSLNRFGQENSYPAIMADKMAAVISGFEFRQALLPEGLAEGTLQFRGLIPGTTLPIIEGSTDGLSREEIAAAQMSGRFNNFGIPGAKVSHLLAPGYPNFYFQRFASSENATIIGDALAMDPTFFTLWIGNNDVLGFATDGGHYLDENGVLQGEAITPVAEFEQAYDEVISQLVASNPNIEGALANIINVADAAFFNVVPWNAFVLESQENVALLNAGFKANIEGPVRNRVILGVITEGARRQIIPPVAEAVVKQQVYNAAIAGGATEEQAQQQADAYVQTDEGKAAIQSLVTTLSMDRLPEEAQDIVEDQLNSEPVQANILTTYEAAVAADQDPERDISEVLGTEGAAAVKINFDSQIAILKAAKYYPQFSFGPNGFVVESETSPTGIIQLTENSRMLLTFLGRTEDEFNPAAGDVIAPDYYALDQEEMSQVIAAVNGYNEVIENAASENSFALVDINQHMNQLSTSGITEDGITFTRAFLTGNTFSLDGVHLTQRGYALVAKKFLEAINSYYNSKIPLPDVSNYPAVGLPASNNN